MCMKNIVHGETKGILWEAVWGQKEVSPQRVTIDPFVFLITFLTDTSV